MNKAAVLVCLLFSVFSLRILAQNAPATVTYPRITGYAGIVHPIVTYSSDVPHYNFDGAYTIGMPTGINIWKSSTIGFSMEFVPHVRTTKGVSKMSNFLFHPGVLAALGKGFVFAGRAAFETSGRFGFTPVLNKTIIKNKNSSYFLAMPFPVRFGNDLPATFTIGFQFGIAF